MEVGALGSNAAGMGAEAAGRSQACRRRWEVRDLGLRRGRAGVARRPAEAWAQTLWATIPGDCT
jgi:hypothetical protein